jgi:hypothetical protein
VKISRQSRYRESVCERDWVVSCYV